ncbi:MAG: hypothetical protein ACTHLA_01635 [Asticcacaulis sp.]|uniref:hypothetical protein n=1 Tax=Asticcacaulis sp. TaxID=1872648 RepID=UPI003F7BE8E9
MKPITQLHPPISETKFIPADVDGGYLINCAGVIEIMKVGDTPQCRRIYRLYLAEYRALDGQPLSHEKKEQEALMAAFRRAGFAIVDAGEVAR